MDARRSSKDTNYRLPGFLLLPPLKFYIFFFLTNLKQYSTIVFQATDDEMIADRSVFCQAFIDALGKGRLGRIRGRKALSSWQLS